ncbi:MAG: hypothetical protein KDF65_05110, partial [Anaerolineae bacterium]|nr:hypothetical protein [Anaerolineae bacterium]
MATPAKPQSGSIVKQRLLLAISLLLFLILVLIVRFGFNRLISGLALPGWEQLLLRLFQIVAGGLTLLPSLGYFYVDRQIARVRLEPLL